MAFELNRINGTSALPALGAANVLIRGDNATIQLPLSSDHEIELYFPAPGGVVESGWLQLAGYVLTYLTEIDNEVQRTSAAQWARTTYPSSYYEGELAYITLITPGEIVLHYYVIGCNSEWDERFALVDGRWVRIALAETGDGAGADTAE